MKKFIFNLVTIVVLSVIFSACGGKRTGNNAGGSNNGPFVRESIESLVRMKLPSAYNNKHVISLKYMGNTNVGITYKWKAEYKLGNSRLQGTGFIYFYENGDIKDFLIQDETPVSN